MRYASGDRYEGSVMHGFFYGQGKFIWSDGGYYEVISSDNLYFDVVISVAG